MIFIYRQRKNLVHIKRQNKRRAKAVNNILGFDKDADIKAIEYISRVTGTVYSDEQKAVLQHRGGMCILACAGSGKTTSLTHLIAKRIQTGEIANPNTLLCTTYSKGGADEMNIRLSKLLKSLGINANVTVKTMHALYLHVLKYFNYPSAVIENKDRIKYLREACKENEITLDDEEFQTLDSLLSYQINNLLSDSDLVKSYAYTLENVSEEDYSKIRKVYNSKKIAAGVVDFDDMQLFMYSLLYQQNRQDVIDFCKYNWTDIYVDEAQDMSRIQYMILKKIIADPNKLVVIGDDDQCIYQWRGADPSIILNICADYDIMQFTLTTNYRCKSNIVDRAATGIVHNGKRCQKTMKAYNEGGEIKICDCGSDNLYTMSKYAYKHIKKLVETDKVRPDKIAVLSRNNAHICILSSMLFKDGIQCEATNEMKMTKNPIYKVIKDVLELSTNGYNHHLTESTLNRVCVYMKKADAVRISKIQDASGCKLSDLIGYMAKKYWNRSDVIWEGNLNIPALTEAKIAQSLYYLRNETVNSLVVLYELLTANDERTRAVGMLEMFLEASSFIYRDNPDKKRTFEGLVAYISDLIKTTGFNETRSFLRVSEQYEEGRMAVPGPKVCMSTMHGAKGKEWENVVLFADDNVTFPSFGGISIKLRNGIALSDVFHELDENRRLHYVAMTRAKDNLTVFTDKRNVGLYMLEAMGIFDYGIANNSHIVSMASEGRIYNDLRVKSDELLFGQNSIYRYDIDIKDMSANIEIDYTFRGTENRQTVSLDSIQTAAPQKTSD